MTLYWGCVWGRLPAGIRGGPNSRHWSRTGMNPQRIVIIGAALAGATAAVTLRDEGFDGEIQLIGAERQLPYNRPPLATAAVTLRDEGFDGEIQLIGAQ